MKVLRITSIGFLFSIAMLNTTAQESVGKTFYDTRLVNGQSVETNNEGVMKFIISHRFGNVNGGAYELYGLDESTIRLGFDYGISDKFSVGIGRSSNEKTFDSFVKLRILEQKKEGTPVSLTYYTNIAARGLDWPNDSIPREFKHRLFYTHQLLLAKKFSDRFSAQVMPSFLHRNLVATADENNDIISIGTAARYVTTKSLTFSFEYYYALPDMLTEEYKNSLAIGIDWETKGHVFSFHLGNSLGMTEKFFIGETKGTWSNGDVRIGFNITRDFKIKGRKER